MKLTERKFPDKLPGPEYKMEIDWYYTFLVIVCHAATVYSFILPEKPFYTGLYGESLLELEKLQLTCF